MERGGKSLAGLVRSEKEDISNCHALGMCQEQVRVLSELDSGV